MVTVKEALKKYREIEIELLLAYVLKKPKEFLYMMPERKLSSYQIKSLSSLAKRREKGEPLAYILGYKDFMGLRFKVNKDVLIPRPETEWIVERVTAKLRSSPPFQGGVPPSGGEAVGETPANDSNPSVRLRVHLPLKREGSSAVNPPLSPIKILDLGTGSGCIAVSLAKNISISQFPNISISASDISSAALKVAKQNARNHDVKIKFIRSNLFSNIKGSFDTIIANLPYVPRKYYVFSIKYLVWEPKSALTDPVKDFDIYERFLREVGSHLNPKGKIYLEIDPKAKPLIAKWQKKYLPKSKIKFFRDYNNLWRYAEITKGVMDQPATN